MAQYIDKAAVIAEIERRRDFIYKRNPLLINSEYCIEEDNAILKFLDSLEVKEVENFIWNNARTTVPENSTNQIICIKEDGLAVSTVGKIVNGTVKWAYLDDLLNNVEMKEVDIEKEFDKCCENYIFDDECEVYTARWFFKLGYDLNRS